MIKTIQVDLTNPKPKTNQKSNNGEPEQKNTKKNPAFRRSKIEYFNPIIKKSDA